MVAEVEIIFLESLVFYTGPFSSSAKERSLPLSDREALSF